MVGGTDFRLSLFDLFKQAEFCQDAVYSRTSFRHLESRKYRGKRFLSSRLRYYSNAVSGYQLTRIVFAGDVSPNPGPVSRRSNATENLLLSAFSTIKHHGRYDITVGHTNARGLHKNLPQVKFLLFHTGLDVLAVSETHLSPAVESYEIAIQGYQLQRKDRLGKIGGGHWKNFQISKYDFSWILLVFYLGFLSYPNLEKMQFFQIWFAICILQYPKLENYRIPDLVLVQSNLGFTNSQSWM